MAYLFVFFGLTGPPPLLAASGVMTKSISFPEPALLSGATVTHEVPCVVEAQGNVTNHDCGNLEFLFPRTQNKTDDAPFCRKFHPLFFFFFFFNTLGEKREYARRKYICSFVRI